jgi:hypothetical protein
LTGIQVGTGADRPVPAQRLIAGYCVVFDHVTVGRQNEELIELRLARAPRSTRSTRTAVDVADLVEVFTIARDRDALVRLRVPSSTTSRA